MSRQETITNTAKMKSSHMRGRRFLRGFTLIELLVVILIIALLMSILLPALKLMKRQTRAVICLARLHNIALYFQMYTQDYNGSFMAGWCHGVSEGWWQCALRGYHRGMNRKGNYSGDYDIFCCPEAEGVNFSFDVLENLSYYTAGNRISEGYSLIAV